MNKSSQTLCFLSGTLLLTKTAAFAMLEEPQSFMGSYTHVQSYNHKNNHNRTQNIDQEPVFKEALISFDSQKKPLKVVVPHKLSQEDLTTLDMNDITTSQCAPYAFKRKIFPLLKGNELDKAALFTLAFVWNNQSEFDEFYAQLRDVDQEIIDVIKRGKADPQLFSTVEEKTRNALAHFIPTKTELEEEVTYDNPFVFEDLSDILTKRKDDILDATLPVSNEEW